MDRWPEEEWDLGFERGGRWYGRIEGDGHVESGGDRRGFTPGPTCARNA